jgi:flagellar motor switch protein FliM
MDSEQDAWGPRLVRPAAEYEGCAPGAFPSGQMAFVRAIQEKFLRTFAQELASRLETPVAARLVAAQPLSSRAFLQSGDDGGCLLTLDAEPAPGQALIALSAGLVANLLRVLLDAPSISGEGSHALTEIEAHILREIFELLARELTAAWKPFGVAFRWMSTGAPEAAPWDGTMLVFDCCLEVDDAPQTFRVASPAYLARLAALQSSPAMAEEASVPARETILRALRRGKVSVEAVLSGSTLRMGDLLAMEPGHVLMLAQAAGSPLECRINGKPKFRGEWISRGDRHALELL